MNLEYQPFLETALSTGAGVIFTLFATAFPTHFATTSTQQISSSHSPLQSSHAYTCQQDSSFALLCLQFGSSLLEVASICSID